jgi:DNA-binding NarL/FixJ family response regulator
MARFSLKVMETSKCAFRILVADNHPVFHLGLCSLLGSHDGWEVCGEAVDGRDAVEKHKELEPDPLVLNICMPELNGADAARQIMKDNPSQRVLILTDVDSAQAIQVCLEAGIRGWVFKSDGISDLTRAVEALQRHKCIFNSARVSDLMVEGYPNRLWRGSRWVREMDTTGISANSR